MGRHSFSPLEIGLPLSHPSLHTLGLKDLIFPRSKVLHWRFWEAGSSELLTDEPALQKSPLEKAEQPGVGPAPWAPRTAGCTGTFLCWSCREPWIHHLPQVAAVQPGKVRHSPSIRILSTTECQSLHRQRSSAEDTMKIKRKWKRNNIQGRCQPQAC